MRRLRRCKIVATLGPVSTPDEMLAKLFAAGVDMFRINMSHTAHDDLRARVFALREVAKRYSRPVAVLCDLQGPKLRVGTFAQTSVRLEIGDKFALDDDETPGDATRVFLPHPEIREALEAGNTVLIDDGKVRLHVLESDGKRALCEVDVAGIVSNRKGVSLPDTEIAVSAMTPKDHADLQAALEIGVDWIAVSFVQRPEDVTEILKIVEGRALVMSKIEKPQALTKLDEIIALSDGLMVARGDLGVEMPLEMVPGIQKRITRRCRRQGKPVVVATQMLESMISSPVPTRAEVSDVAQAVFEGADAIMLSAESAVGKYPIEAVSFMDRIAVQVGERPGLPLDHQRATPRARADGGRCRRHRRPRHGRDVGDQSHRRLDRFGVHRLPCRPRACRAADHRAHTLCRHGAAGSRWSGVSTPSSPRTRRTSTTWSTAPARRRSRRVSPLRATGSS